MQHWQITFSRFCVNVSRHACVVFIAIHALLAIPAAAQVDNGDPVIAGVYVDADGMLRARQLQSNPRLNAIRQRARDTQQKDDLTYVSLPRLFNEVKALTEAGKTVPDDLKFLHGMVELQFIFVYPNENDIVIAGPAEELDSTDARRPIGKKTGRPALQLDDLIVALRLVGPGGRTKQFGCSIDMPQGAMERARAAQLQAGAIASRTTKMKRIGQAVGPQHVQFFGIEPDTRFAFVLLEADYRLKRLGLGLDKSPVRSVRHTVGRDAPRFNRWWFKPAFEPLLVSEDGHAYEIHGQTMIVDTAGSQTNNAIEASDSAKRYAQQATKHFDTLATAIPAWADMANLADLTLLAALIREDKLHQKTNWDFSWAMASKGYTLPRVDVPQKADTLVAHLGGGYAAGGVLMTVEQGVVNRKTDSDNRVMPHAHRPADEAWHATRERPLQQK